MAQVSDSAISIQILVTPNFNMSATMGFIDPFRAANYLDGMTRFRWNFVSEAGGTCLSSNGASIQTSALGDRKSKGADIVIVSSSWAPENYATTAVQSALRQWARQGITIGGLDTGAFILAQSGLLDGKRATVHYEHIDAFIELFPNTAVSENLYVFDGNRVSCSGGTAAVDFGLHILQGIQGPALTNAVARYIFHTNLRERGTPQQPKGEEPLGHLVPADVKAAIKVMEENLEEPVSIPYICEQVNISHRQLDRLFAQYIKKTPALYYRDIRLDRARGLVTQTELSISEISVACGFSSQIHFSRSYRDRFGLPPIKDRIDGRVPFEFRAWPMHRKKH